ncbi:FAD-dependent monooxygenase [Acuticoccus sp. M5D2P5]|uniref:FAD-dependent oxidoreductase n=1 Tax=Acuticoccus kalidii TaxID=2910977 RepID=UPI001F29DB59|nr:NAD(P)/FAD-dependent oxidoreductase [Acuticoccus kalidii]MCF3935660.1 FAD-dependent monooxygenase [Acuticoccus kalidii]
MHVFIAGAGPVGLSAAIALTARGHRVTIADRAMGVTSESRAVAVNHNSLGLLAPSGVAQAILETGETVRTVRIMKEDALLARLKVPGQDRRWPTMVALPQSETERLMETAFERIGGRVMWGHSLVTVSQTQAGVTATIRADDTGAETVIEADLALGAEGTHSVTREALGLRFEGRQLPTTWSLADITCDWPFAEQACAVISDEGTINFLITLGNGRFRAIGNHPDVLAVVESMMRIEEVHWSNPFTVQLRVASAMGKGRIAIAGDAAHSHSPVGGQGMNLGIADAYAFADAVDAGDLAPYMAERPGAARRVVARTDRAYRLLSSTSKGARIARDTLLRSAGFVTRLLV